MEWSRDGGELADVVRRQTQACLSVYREDPSRITQDANNELRIREGGYRDRQLIELLQNAVDAGGRRIEVRLADDTLYVANDGKPFDARGIEALMASDLSTKTDAHVDHIGRFGIGFKSVLAISPGPRVYSRSVSFTFDAGTARRRIEGAGFNSPSYPTMRVAEVVDPRVDKRGDKHLQDLMTWAATIVCLPLVSGAGDDLEVKIREMPGQFLLFSPRVDWARLYITGARQEVDRMLTRVAMSPWQVRLSENGERDDWLVLSTRHRPSARARAAAGRLADRETVPVSWALPLERLGGLGAFWTYFPTEALTTLSGLVNAPWQVSDDRLNLLETRFNHELLTEVLPKLLTDNLDKIHSPENPTRVLDLLPARGRESRSWADEVVNEPMVSAARSSACLPDLNGRLSLDPPTGSGS
ncbi:ATP-binding protein [uncultured Pseudokineococcus sp.]|uniref:ATP-binding protein n=1 Tax=uncultured Pseudokineococcus sp. TaxID=1642928 RepID=UPI00262BE7B0|nr:ATP-binding protein [uncultured Pseudokineococcus sp.]